LAQSNANKKESEFNKTQWARDNLKKEDDNALFANGGAMAIAGAIAGFILPGIGPFIGAAVGAAVGAAAGSISTAIVGAETDVEE
jgi:uncharacterized membrane protein